MMRRAYTALRRKLGQLSTRWRDIQPNSGSVIRVATRVPPSIMAAVAANGLLLDRRAITHRLGIDAGMMGAIPATAAGRRSIILAHRMAARFARTYAPRMGLEPSLVTGAVCFDFWSQLSVLIPLRHLARKIARQAGVELILIELPTLDVACLEAWKPNQLEPLFLYTELARLGANVFLYCSAPPAEGRDESAIALRFRIVNDSWAPAPAGPSPMCALNSKKAIVVSAIRGIDHILAEHGPMHLIACAHAPHQQFCESLMRDVPPPPEIAIALTRTNQRTKNGPLTTYEGRADSLLDQAFYFLRDTLPLAARNAERVVAACGIEELHCCDHYFVESVLMSHAVKRRGGRVVLWPHSANPNHYLIRGAGEVDEIYCITQSGKRLWNSRLPNTPVIAMPQLMLRPSSGPRPGVSGAPLSVVVIGGAHFLGRLPMLHIEGHAELNRRLFARLREHSQTMDVYFRPKPLFEDEHWLRHLLGVEQGYKIAEREPMAIDVPNPVFVMVSSASTAVLEGIGRGIPSLIVREFPVEDYIPVDDRFVPVGPVDLIIDQLKLCIDEQYRNEVLLRQVEWYNSELGLGFRESGEAFGRVRRP